MKKYKNGSVLVIVLMFVSLLFVGAAMMARQRSQQIMRNQDVTLRLQAYFAARSALQHSMLKIQLTPTELYDAAEFSVGKNPFFDYTQFSSPPTLFPYRQIGSYYIKLASDLNPGPRFITKLPSNLPATEEEKWSRIEEFHPQDLTHTPNVSPWPTDHQGNDIANPSLYLWKYYSDINSENGSMTMTLEPDWNQLDFPTQSPYTMTYQVKNIEVVALNEQRRYNEEAVKIRVVGEVNDIRSNSFTHSLDTIVRIRRNP